MRYMRQTPAQNNQDFVAVIKHRLLLSSIDTQARSSQAVYTIQVLFWHYATKLQPTCHGHWQCIFYFDLNLYTDTKCLQVPSLSVSQRSKLRCVAKHLSNFYGTMKKKKLLRWNSNPGLSDLMLRLCHLSQQRNTRLFFSAH